MPFDPSSMTSYTLEAAVALLIIKEVFVFIKWWKTGERVEHHSNEHNILKEKVDKTKEIVERISTFFDKFITTIDDIKYQNNEMYEWHNKNDAEGVKIWYVRRSLETAIEKLTESIAIQTNVLKEILQDQRENKKDTERLTREFENFSRNELNRNRGTTGKDIE